MAAPKAGKHKIHILVVEDQDSLREVLSYCLGEEGWQVSVAPSGEEALRLAQTQRFDLVMSDLQLPGMDGLQTLAKLKEKQKDLEVILMTGFAQTTESLDQLKQHVPNCLLKPFNTDQLYQSISRALKNIHHK